MEVAGSGLSYTFCTAPSVGASGAIFGLVSISQFFIFDLNFGDHWHPLMVKCGLPPVRPVKCQIDVF